MRTLIFLSYILSTLSSFAFSKSELSLEPSDTIYTVTLASPYRIICDIKVVGDAKIAYTVEGSNNMKEIKLNKVKYVSYKDGRTVHYNSSEQENKEYKNVNSNLYLKNNSIYGGVGSSGFFSFTATGYLERIIKQKMWNKNISSFVKVGYGGETHWAGGSKYFLAHFGLLTGANKHHLELSLGPVFFKGDLKGELPMSGTIGWRVQEPEGHFIFRMGASWPEAVYLGLGFSF